MADLGRISGQMLSANLERFGVDLTFDTDQLYLDLDLNGTGGVGINTDAFTRTLEVNQYTRTVNLIADRLALPTITIENNYISTLSGPLYISAAGGAAGTILFDRNEVDDLFFDGNVIGSKSSNTNIELDASGTGTVDFNSDVNVYNNINLTGNIDIDGDLFVGGQIDIGSQAGDTVEINPVFSQDLKPDEDARYNLGTPSRRWFNLNLTNYIDLENIKIDQNAIVTSISNSNLELSGNGTGGAQAEGIIFVNNRITSASDNILISANVVFSGTNGVVAPAGSTANRTSLNLGEFRYNTNNQNFEGFTTGKIHFNGVADSDYNTRVFTDSVRSNDDDTIRFNVSGTEKLAISESAFVASQILVNNSLQLESTQSKITTSQLNSDLILQSSGTGNVSLAEIGFSDNTISAQIDNIILSTTGESYYQIGGDGFVIPSGPTVTVAPPNTQIGDFRFNTDTGNLEVFNGVVYGLAQGAAEEVTQSQLDEILDLYIVVFG
jgi:hypothetical protein